MINFLITVFFVLILIFDSSAAQQNREQLNSGYFKQRKLLQKPVRTSLKKWEDRKHIEVKFLDDFNFSLNEDDYPYEKDGKALNSIQAKKLLEMFSKNGGKWNRMAAISEYEIENLRLNAQENLNRAIANLNNYFILSVPENQNSEDWINQLNALSEVELAKPLLLPLPLPQPGNYQAKQGYLNTATTGIGATFAWFVNDSGQNVTICDVEYWWNLNHNDLPSGISMLIPPGYVAIDPIGDDNHGTAVLGELVSLRNGIGTTGACYGSNVKVAPTFLNGSWLLTTALTYVISNLQAGDIILIEQQGAGPYYTGSSDTGLVPVEWDPTVYEIILTAIGNGIHVIEAGANGYQNLDATIYSTGNYGHWPFLSQNNSGAIIVGAGAAPSAFFGSDVARSRLAFSNYGSRVNLQGWGEKVTTTGTFPSICPPFYTASGKNYYYDSCFAGTSSASPIVAAAVALVESRYENLYNRPLPPLTMRSILMATGSPQQNGTFPISQNIGPLPDVQSALSYNFNSLLVAGGTYSVGNSYTFKKLSQIADTLNKIILTGDVIFELQSDYDGTTGEIFPIRFNEYLTSGGNWTVTIRPASGVSMRTTQGNVYGEFPLIDFNGADRIILDGRAGGTGDSIFWTIRNLSNSFVGPSIRLNNDATYNVLKYLKIEGSNTSSYSGTVYFGEHTMTSGNSHNIILNCEIRDRSDLASPQPVNAIYSDWTTNAPNDSNTIQDSKIYNWSNYGLKLYGMRWNIISNSIYQNVSQNQQMTGIYLLPSTSQRSGGHFISSNFIGGILPMAEGTPLVDVSGLTFTGISLNIDTNLVSTVKDNKIKNIYLTKPVMSSSFIGIDINGMNIYSKARADICGNVIGDTSLSKKIKIDGGGVVIGIKILFVDTANVSQNMIVNVVQTPPFANDFIGIYVNSHYTNIYKNFIYNVGPSDVNASSNVSGFLFDFINDSVTVVNNMVSLAVGLSNKCTYTGIFDKIFSGKIFNNLFFNSIYIGGSSSGLDSSYCYRRTGVSIVNIKNNIFCNERSGIGFHIAIANSVHPVNWLPGFSDKNIFYNLNNSHLTGWLNMFSNLPIWIAMSNCDFSSYNADPKFVNPSSNNLHINPAVYSYADNNGIPIGILDDFDGNTRGGSPDIGADEYIINSPSSFTLVSPINGTLNQPLNGKLIWRSSQAAGNYLVYLDTLIPPTFVISQTDTSYSYTSLDTNKTYYWQVHAVNSSANIQATGSPWYFYTGAIPGMVTNSYSFEKGWNLLSVPLLVSDFRKNVLYPTSTSKAFVYNSGYVEKETLSVGIGYWIKFSDTGHVPMTGYLCDPETVDVYSGWNLIGSASNVVSVNSISSIPGSMVTSNFYKYSFGYLISDTIYPGKGYWVKVEQNGKLILSSSGIFNTLSNIKIVSINELPPNPPLEAVSEIEEIPEEFVLYQNYPNPFNPITEIQFGIPEASFVTLKVYNTLGQELLTLVNEEKKPGKYKVEFNGSQFSSGIYFYRFVTADFMAVKKFVLIK